MITRLAVLDLSHETRGNALGIGLADLTTERLVRGIDPEPMRVNSLTSNFLTRARVPLALPTDRDVIATSLDTCWRIDPAEARMVLIPNTLELTTLWVTRALRRPRSRAIRSSASRPSSAPIPFDASRKPRAGRAVSGEPSSAEAKVLIRAVVFDLDGLMFDTEALFFRVASEALADRGKAFTPEIMKQFIGRRAARLLQLWKTLAGVEGPVEDFLADVRKRFYAAMDTAVHPMPGLFVLLDLLHRLAASGRRGDLVPATPMPTACSCATASRTDLRSCSRPRT